MTHALRLPRTPSATRRRRLAALLAMGLLALVAGMTAAVTAPDGPPRPALAGEGIPYHHDDV